MIELLQKLFDESLDKELAMFYINNAKNSIQNYMNLNTLDSSYNNAIVLLAKYYILQDNVVKSKKEGTKSITFRDNIPVDIKTLLPKPYMGVM